MKKWMDGMDSPKAPPALLIFRIRSIRKIRGEISSIQLTGDDLDRVLAMHARQVMDLATA